MCGSLAAPRCEEALRLLALEQQSCLLCSESVVVPACWRRAHSPAAGFLWGHRGQERYYGLLGPLWPLFRAEEFAYAAAMLRKGWFFPEYCLQPWPISSPDFSAGGNPGMWLKMHFASLLARAEPTTGPSAFPETWLLNHSFDQRPAQSTFFLLQTGTAQSLDVLEALIKDKAKCVWKQVNGIFWSAGSLYFWARWHSVQMEYF